MPKRQEGEKGEKGGIIGVSLELPIPIFAWVTRDSYLTRMCGYASRLGISELHDNICRGLSGNRRIC